MDKDYLFMDRNEFIKNYSDLLKLVVVRLEKASKEGLLSLEDDLDVDKIYERDIFEYGMMLVLNGIEPELIGEILSNIIEQEKDEYTRLFKKIQSEAAYCLYNVHSVKDASDDVLIRGDINRMYYKLNSLSGLSFNDDPVKEFVEGRTEYPLPKKEKKR